MHDCTLDIDSVILGTIAHNSISVPVEFATNQMNDQQTVELQALIDSGAGGKFINQNFERLANEKLAYAIRHFGNKKRKPLVKKPMTKPTIEEISDYQPIEPLKS